MRKAVLSALLCVLWSWQTFSQAEYQVIKDLRYSWKSYDEQTKLWIPYLSNSASNTILFEVDLNQFQGADLLLIVPENHSILLNHQLIQVTQQLDSLLWLVDSLQAHYKSSNLSVEVFGKSRDKSRLQSLVVQNAQSRGFDSEMTLLDSRELSEETNVMILGTLFVFFVLVIFRTFVYRVYQEYFLISRALSVRQKFELIDSQSTISPVNLGFIFLYSVFVGGTVLNLALKLDSNTLDNWSVFLDQTPVTISIYAILIAFSAMLLKVSLVKILTGLFSVQKYSDVHYFTYLRLSLIISFVMFIASVLFFLSPDTSSSLIWTIFKYSLLVILFIRLILMYLVLNNSFSFNKFHLISYLCSSEMIPLIILVKTLLG